MDLSIDELDALGRIIKAIKRYGQTVSHQQPTNNLAREAYLNQQLSAPDWQLWQRLQEEPPEKMVDRQDLSLDQVLPGQPFDLLVDHYLQAVFNSFLHAR